MISAWWLIPVYIIGLFSGVVMMCMCIAAKEN